MATKQYLTSPSSWQRGTTEVYRLDWDNHVFAARAAFFIDHGCQCLLTIIGQYGARSQIHTTNTTIVTNFA